MSKLSGKPPKPWWVEMGIDPDMPFWTAAEKEAALKMFEHLRPKIDFPHKGQVVVFGTAGDMDNNADMLKMFYQPNIQNFDKWGNEVGQ